MGVPETAAQGIEADGASATRLPEQGELPACLHARPDRRGLSRGGLVSFLRAAGARTNHPATLDQRRNRSRIRIRQEPHGRLLAEPAGLLTKASAGPTRARGAGASSTVFPRPWRSVLRAFHVHGQNAG